MPIFGPKICIFFYATLMKPPFFSSYGTPFFVKGALVTLGVGSVLAPSDLLCNFSFPSYAIFVRGTRPTGQKVFPHPTVGAPSACNSPSALSARAGQGYHSYQNNEGLLYILFI